MGRRILFSIHESQTLTADTWARFAELATRNGGTISAALVDLIQRYIREHESPERNA